MQPQEILENKEAEAKTAEENKAAAESTVEGGEGNAQAPSTDSTDSKDFTESTNADASIASTESEETKPDTYNVNGTEA